MLINFEVCTVSRKMNHFHVLIKMDAIRDIWKCNVILISELWRWWLANSLQVY